MKVHAIILEADSHCMSAEPSAEKNIVSVCLPKKLIR